MAEFEDIWYESDDGLRLYARDYPSQQPKAAQTLLCMHGLTRNSADFADLAPALQQQCRVIAVDQRGRGKSAWDKSPANYTPARYVADMFTLIKAQRLRNVVLLGTSMGGLMSMMMVAQQPEAFHGVILNDIGPVVAPAGLARIKGYVGKGKPIKTREEAVRQVQALNQALFPHYQQEDWQRWVARTYRQNAKGELVPDYDPAIAQPLHDDQAAAVPPDLWPLFEALKPLPLLLIRGALSDILAADCAAEMQRRHPAMQYLEVPATGHAPMLDEPQVLPALTTFLTTCR